MLLFKEIKNTVGMCNLHEEEQEVIITADGMKYRELREEWAPVKLVEAHNVLYTEWLLKTKPACVSFKGTECTKFNGPGSFVVLDFGKELCGGIRMITRDAKGPVKWRLTFGESLTEAYSSIGEKNATNDHSPRDMEVVTGMMSDLILGQTGFRFVRVELIEGEWAMMQSIFAVSILPYMEREAEITTNDTLLNEIIKTAAYTLKLTFQNGYIWDGIKRDRLVWCGDLNPEIITSLYLFGDNDNIKNSLNFLKEITPAEDWMNWIPTYSAWWVINLCDYCKHTGNRKYFKENKKYAREVINHFDRCIQDDGSMNLTNGKGMEFFLDWSTYGFEETKAGVAAVIMIMANKYLAIEENAVCRRLLSKLSCYLDMETKQKPICAFQVLAGRDSATDANMLQEGGAKGLSTFMAYYILTAMAKNGTEMLSILKEYYGGMLSCGATTFWEDFDIDWLENSARIDEIPKEGQNDIHGDFGKHCYVKFRHSLCHGWAAGVYAFIVEYILGIRIENGGKKIYFTPHLSGLKDVEARIPLKKGWLKISIHGDERNIEAPKGTEIV